MKMIIFLGWLILFFAQTIWAQERIEAPVWNGGDKWVFTQGMSMEVIRTDENAYVVELPNQTILFEKPTLNRIFTLRGKKREAYKESQRRLFDFPLIIGKKWKGNYLTQLRTEDIWTHTSKAAVFSLGGNETKIFENYKVLGWEEVEVEAGRFKAVKVEYKREWNSSPGGMREGKAWYWYSPEVKNMVKVQYEKNEMWSKETDWELISFHLAQ